MLDHDSQDRGQSTYSFAASEVSHVLVELSWGSRAVTLASYSDGRSLTLTATTLRIAD
jgi:hypothetical protein